jgi:hypothetical protein
MDERFALFSYLAQMAVDLIPASSVFRSSPRRPVGLEADFVGRSAHDAQCATGGMDFALKFAGSRPFLKLFFAR